MVSDLQFKPVTPETMEDFIALFEARGGPKYCWCMAWRGDRQEKQQTGSADKRRQMLSRITARTPVGLLAYSGGKPCAWVSIAPRATHIRLGGPDEEPGDNIWSLTCMFIPRPLRGQGMAHRLIAAALDHAKANGATVIEAYPVAPDSPSYRFMGFVSAFEKAGFAFVQMAGSRRHVMRRLLTPDKS